MSKRESRYIYILTIRRNNFLNTYFNKRKNIKPFESFPSFHVFGEFYFCAIEKYERNS